MLMASLAQELTSSMRHLSRSSAAAAAAAGPAAAGPAAGGLQSTSSASGGQQAGGGGVGPSGGAGAFSWSGGATGETPSYSSSGATGRQRASFEVPLTSSYTGAGDASSSGSSGSSGSGGDAAGFAPRLQLVSHTSGPLKVAPPCRPDVLMVDVDTQQLVMQLEAYSKQQKRDSRQQQQYAAGLSRRTDSSDLASSIPSARSSRSNSLDLMGLVVQGPFGADGLASAAGNSSRTSPQQQQHQQAQAYTPRSSGISGQTSSPGAAAGTAAGTASGTAAAAAAGVLSRAGSASTVTEAAGGQWVGGVRPHPLHRRRPLPPAVCAALEGLCLLHKWGLEPGLDQQLVLLLQEQQGWGDADAPGGALMPGGHSSSSSSPLPPSPGAEAGCGRGRCAAAAVSSSYAAAGDEEAPAGAPQLLQWLSGLLVCLQGPAAGSPVLQGSGPCLTQEVLLSPRCHAAVIGLPATHCSNSGLQQQQQQREPERDYVNAGDGVDQPLSSLNGGQLGGGTGNGGGGTQGNKAGGGAAAVIGSNLLLWMSCPTLLASR
jgi:hypothetical protein